MGNPNECIHAPVSVHHVVRSDGTVRIRLWYEGWHKDLLPKGALFSGWEMTHTYGARGEETCLEWNGYPRKGIIPSGAVEVR